MDIPCKTLQSGFTLPVFGFGTSRMGGRYERDMDNDDLKDVWAIQRALDQGVTFIDTAERYAGGYAETLIGRAIQGVDRRRLTLCSKVRLNHLGYDDILRACEQSLKRLQTDYLDLYLLHRYHPTIPLKESVRALDRLMDEGLVRQIGVSNFGKAHLAEAQAHASHKIVCNQVHYNLRCREAEYSGLLEYCQRNDVFLMAWQPLEKGSLVQDVPIVVHDLCMKYQKTPAQIAINWLISQPRVLTLSKMIQAEHLTENLGAVGWIMEAQDIERLRREYPDQQRVSARVPLG